MPVIRESVGPYRVLGPIAAGGMAEVYEVQDPVTGLRYALKLLLLVRKAKKRFDREYEAMVRLNHPGIVRVYDYGLHEHHPWLTMELLRGDSAQLHLRSFGKPGTPERTAEVLRVGYFIANALQYIHARGLIHRDLKSGNVLVLPDGRVKVVDFGVAHVVDAEPITGLEFVGTFQYAAPEQVQAKPVDHRADLYSLGVLLYCLATGRKPFSGRSKQDVALRHVHAPVPDPLAHVPELPTGLGELIYQLMQKAPADRVQSAGEVAQRLEGFAGRSFDSHTPLALQGAEASARVNEHAAVWSKLDGHDAGEVILVDGDAGSDRSRFVRRVHDTALRGGWKVVRVSFDGTQARKRLASAFLQMAEGIQGPGVKEAASIVGRAWQAEFLARPHTRRGLCTSAARLVRARVEAESRPVVLVADGLELAAIPAVEWLGDVWRVLREQGVPVALVASCGGGRDMGRTVARAFPAARRILLEPLDPAAVAVAVGQLLGRKAPPAELARALQLRTGGQPLYVEDAVAALVRSNTVRADGDRVAWAEDVPELPVPAAARALAETLIHTLPAAHLRVVQAVHLAGDAARAEVVAAALDLEIEELQPLLKVLVRRGLLRADADGVTLALPLLGDVVHAVHGPVRMRTLYRKIAGALAEAPPSHGQVRAFAESGWHERAVGAALVVALAHMERGEHRDALEVLDLISEQARAEPSELGAQASLLHGLCLMRLRPTDPEAVRSLRRAREGSGEDSAFTARVELATARHCAVLGHYPGFRRGLATAWAAASKAGDPALKAQLALELARSRRFHGHIEDAQAWADKALTAAREAEEVGLISRSYAVLGHCALAAGRLRQAQQQVERALTAGERDPDPTPRWLAAAVQADVLRAMGRFTEAMAALAARVHQARHHSDPGPVIRLLLAEARCHLDLSRLGRAQECLDELAATVNKAERLHVRLEVQVLHGRILIASGQLAEAAWRLTDAQASADRAGLRGLAEWARGLLAEAVWALGNIERGGELFEEARAALLEMGDLMGLADVTVGHARALEGSTSPDALFAPLDALMHREPAQALRLECILAQREWHQHRGHALRAAQVAREAAMALNRIGSTLGHTDRAALRVHPWSRRIRQGLVLSADVVPERVRRAPTAPPRMRRPQVRELDPQEVSSNSNT